MSSPPPSPSTPSQRNEPSFIKVRFFIRVFQDIFSLLCSLEAMKKKVEWFLVTLCFESTPFSKFYTATAFAAY